MNPFSRTLKFAGVAAVSALLAAGSWYATQPSDVAGFGDVGQEFFPDFDDVVKATSLSVVDYDSDQKESASFSVEQNDDGLWVIPSHHSYPAEAEDRLAKTATSLMGVRKSAVQSRSKDDWKRYGVVDPDASGAATAEERGTRLTLSDGSGNPLVDLIVGNEVEGRSGNYYVRVPDNNTTFVSELDIDLSAKFSDWIEPDLLKITSSDVVKVTLDNYSVNEERGTVEKKELLEFAKTNLETTGDWQLADLNEEAEELDKSPVTSIASSLQQLKIVGVRPKPDGLNSNLRVNPAVKQILQMQMQSQGYFIGGDKDGNERLYSNEGELIAGLSNGVEYTLYFGEIARGTGKDIEVGLSDDAKAADEEKKVGDESDESDDEDAEDGPRRYLLVKVDFNESLLGDKPVAPVEPVMPEILKAAAEEKVDSKETANGDEANDAPEEEAVEEPQNKDSEEADPCGAFDETSVADEAVVDEPVKADQPATDPPVEEQATESNPASKEAATTGSEKAEPAKSEATESTKEADVKKPADQPKADAKDEQPEEQAAKKNEAPAKPKAGEKAATPTKESAAKEPVTPAKDPKQIAQENFDAAVATYKAAKSAYDRDLKAYEDKVEAGQKKVKELATRFGSWYYVISSDSFEKFRIERKDVVSAKVKEDAASEDKDADK